MYTNLEAAEFENWQSLREWAEILLSPEIRGFRFFSMDTTGKAEFWGEF